MFWDTPVTVQEDLWGRRFSPYLLSKCWRTYDRLLPDLDLQQRLKKKKLYITLNTNCLKMKDGAHKRV